MSQPTRFSAAGPICKRVAQLGARGDLQLRKYSIKMAADCSRRQEKAFRDLTVRQTFGGKLSDLELLRGQAIAKVGRAPPNPFSGGAELLASSAAPGRGSQRIEKSHALLQRCP